jgi:hypothetical protein
LRFFPGDFSFSSPELATLASFLISDAVASGFMVAIAARFAAFSIGYFVHPIDFYSSKKYITLLSTQEPSM